MAAKVLAPTSRSTVSCETIDRSEVIQWLELIEVDLEAGDLSPKTRVMWALHRVKAS